MHNLAILITICKSLPPDHSLLRKAQRAIDGVLQQFLFSNLLLKAQ